MSRRALHAVIALILISCLLSPFVEIALGSNDSVFQTGRDTESSLALLALVVELVLVIARVLAVCLPSCRLTELLVVQNGIVRPEPDPAITLPELSPPLPLRI